MVSIGIQSTWLLRDGAKKFSIGLCSYVPAQAWWFNFELCCSASIWSDVFDKLVGVA